MRCGLHLNLVKYHKSCEDEKPVTPPTLRKPKTCNPLHLEDA